ncbi:MAG: CoA transferase [Burkholderiales bacterium]|nr:CoA transferase [Burkholderiales bacterium]
MGPLTGIRVIEIAGLGPAPFCGMLLADMGAEVILVERACSKPGDPLDLGQHAIFNRGKRSLALDLKQPAAAEAVLKLIDRADALIEGMRPGAMERLGLGPDVALARNPKLVYGRMTGWGQTGPLAQSAGHDINYIALSGALWYAGQPGTAPVAPPTLVGDLGGGALYLAMGLLAGILHARSGGPGQVIDAAVVDGSANMMNLMLSLYAAGQQPIERGKGLLDGPHWYGSYRCSCGGFVTIGAMEPHFYTQLLEKLQLTDDADFRRQYDPGMWPQLKARLEALFLSQPRTHWQSVLEGLDTCFAPVLEPQVARHHPHLAARAVYAETNGVLQAAPAPRFSTFPTVQPGAIPTRGADGAQVLREAGLTETELRQILPHAG